MQPYQFKAFREMLRSGLASLRQSTEELTIAMREASGACNRATEEISSRLSELRLPAEVLASSDARHRKAHGQQVWLTWGTWLAFLAAVVYAGIAACQVKIAQNQLAEMAKQYPEIQKSAAAAEKAAIAAHDSVIQNENHFRLDQRPYIAETTNSVAPPTFRPTHDDLGQILWSYRVTNYGKSPAYDVQEKRFIKVGDRPYMESYTEGNAIRRIGTAMAPTAEILSTVVSKPMTSQTYQDVIGEKSGDPISIKVTITYRDSYGVAYETDICLGYNPSSAIRFCDGNHIK